MKTDTTENWLKCEDKYIPAPFTIIVYQDMGKAPKIKISNGVNFLKDLPFINMENTKSSVNEEILEL